MSTTTYVFVEKKIRKMSISFGGEKSTLSGALIKAFSFVTA